MDPQLMALMMLAQQKAGGQPGMPGMPQAGPMPPGLPPGPAAMPPLPQTSTAPLGTPAVPPRSAPGLMPASVPQTQPMVGTYESPVGSAASSQTGTSGTNTSVPVMKGDSAHDVEQRQARGGGDDKQRPVYPNALPTFPRSDLGALLLPKGPIAQTMTGPPNAASAFQIPALGQFLQKLTA